MRRFAFPVIGHLSTVDIALVCKVLQPLVSTKLWRGLTRSIVPVTTRNVICTATWESSGRRLCGVQPLYEEGRSPGSIVEAAC
jgi:hypothetical protein